MKKEIHMKMHVLIDASRAIRKIYQADPVIDAEKFLKLKKIARAVNTEYEDFDEANRQKRSQLGIDEKGKIVGGNDEEKSRKKAEYEKFLSDLAGAELSIRIDPILSEMDMIALKLNIDDQEKLEAIGLVETEEQDGKTAQKAQDAPLKR